MVTIAEVVEKIIRKSPYLEEGLTKELINLSALAREIQPEVQSLLIKDVQVGAIVMALKRLKPKLAIKTIRPRDYIKQIGDLTVKSNLVEYTFKNSRNLISKEKELLELLSDKTDSFITISQGVQETTIIVNKSLTEDVKRIFEGEEVILNLTNLSSITLKLPASNVEVPGVYYSILKAIAWNGINIIDAVSTSNEVTIIFRNADIDKAFSILKRITDNNGDY
ncbi:aspartate kinase [Candidatus Dojkabacteria bacterium]|uniref:Aspartate kinase n=1 Tax=Candidatus Dojkabacteria bacterium TaxID=2099670 RepID=A0A955L7U4_9BACT|nr:aspartate kinase [Candidatus Dojkabacteria bacterium]